MSPTSSSQKLVNRRSENDGNKVEYHVTQQLVRRAKKKGFIQRILIGALGLLIGLPAFAVTAPLLYLVMLNKTISQRFAARMLPVVMPMMDKAFGNVKRELLKDLHGRVLDVGCGEGDWLKYFTKASHVTELEPNPHLIPLIERNVKKFKQANPAIEVEIANKFVHELDPSKPYDYVVFGNVMCEVPHPARFVQEIDRILKPGGKVVFQEHIKSPDGTWKATLQDWVNGWWVTISDGCNCNRTTLQTIQSVKGWQVEWWDLEYDAPPNLDRMVVGIATKTIGDDGETLKTSSTPARM